MFEYVRNPDSTWTETVPYVFCSLDFCADGTQSSAGLISDAKGNLYGVTFGGGSNLKGVLFELEMN